MARGMTLFTVRNALGALAILFTLTACGADELALASHAEGAKRGTTTTPPPPPPPPAPAVTVGFATAVPVGPYASSSSFVLFDTPRVVVVADWTGLASTQAVRVDLFTPSGRLWSSTVVPLAGAAGSSATVTATGPDAWRVTAALEIWGTAVESYNMVGAWRADVSVDGSREPPVSAGFALR